MATRQRGSPTAHSSPLSHSELVLKARQQAARTSEWQQQMQASSPQSPLLNASQELGSSGLLSSSFMRRSPSKESPMKPTGLASLLAASGAKAGMATQLARSPSTGPISPLLSVSPDRFRAASDMSPAAEQVVAAEVHRRVQAEHQLEELSRRLFTTKAALQVSERRADKVVAGAGGQPMSARSSSPPLSSRIRLGSSSISADHTRVVSPRRAVLDSTARRSRSRSVEVPLMRQSLASVATETGLSLAQVQLENATRKLSERTEENERQLFSSICESEQAVAEISRDCSLHIAVEQAKLATRNATVADVEAKTARAEREITNLKDRNAELESHIHVLESDVSGRKTTADHQAQLLVETQEERQLRVASLERDMALTESKLRDASAHVKQLLLEKARAEAVQRESDRLLSERTRELELALAEKLKLQQTYEGLLENGRLKGVRLEREVSATQIQQRLICEKDVGAALAEVDMCQKQCRDEKRAVAMVQEQLEQGRRDMATCEDSKNEMSHLISELGDQRKTEKRQFDKDVQNVEASAEAAQRALHSELEETKTEVNMLREEKLQRDQQLRDCQNSSAVLAGAKNEAEALRREALQELSHSEGLVADLRRSLNAAVCEKEEVVVKCSDSVTHVGVERESLERRVALLASELTDARRAGATAAAEIALGERRLKGSEDRLHHTVGEVETQARRSFEHLQKEHDALLNKLVLAEQDRTKYSFQLQDEQRRSRSVQDSLQDKAQQLRDQLATESADSQAQAKTDNLRLQELERENVRLQAQSGEFARQLASLDSLNRGLRERLQVVERGP